MKKILAAFTIIFLLSSGVALSQEKSFVASLEMDRVSVGNPVYLTITFNGSQDIDRPDMPSYAGLQIKYVGPASKMSWINGKVSQSITHTYLVIPLRGGRFELGPFFAEYRGQTYKSEMVTLIANDLPGVSYPTSKQSGTPPLSNRIDRDPGGVAYRAGDKVFLEMEIAKTRMYVNETVPVTINIYVYDMGLKDVEYPVYFHEGFSAGKIEKPERRWKVIKGISYDALSFKQDLFAIKEGEYILGPAKLSCKIVIRRESRMGRGSRLHITLNDFFSGGFGNRVYPIEIVSNEIPVTILPLPEESQPKGFQGAVGKFRMDVNVTPQKVKVGDPIVISTTIRGEGNIDTVTAPLIKDSENFKTYEPEVKKKGNTKTYEQIFIPKTEEVKEIPEVTFSFFDSKAEKYRTIKKGPFPVEVIAQPVGERAVRMVSMPGEEQIFYPKEKLGSDIVYIKESIGELQSKGSLLYKNWMFWLGQLLFLVISIVFYSSRKKKERILKDEKYARFLKAPRKARKGLAKAKSYLGKDDALPFYDIIFKTLQGYLAGRFSLPIGNITIGVVEERLRPAGCDKDILDMLYNVFSKCEMARYASSVPGGHEAEEVLDKVKRIIDYLEKIKI